MDAGKRGKTGPKPGQPHAGQFVKGDPRINRQGGPRKTFDRREFELLIAEAAPMAVDALKAVLRDDDAAPKDRVGAAELLLNHAVGMPVSRSVIATLGDGSNADFSQLSTPVLRQRLSRLLEGEGAQGLLIQQEAST